MSIGEGLAQARRRVALTVTQVSERTCIRETIISGIERDDYSGVPVQIGLYCAPLALVGYALFGGSRLLVYAAAGSVAAVSASVVGGLHAKSVTQAVTLTAALAVAAGAVFVVAGLARMGWISNFMSKAVMAGFICGAGIDLRGDRQPAHHARQEDPPWPAVLHDPDRTPRVHVGDVVIGGCVVALVGFSEGWGSVTTIARKTHDDPNPNQEFRHLEPG